MKAIIMAGGEGSRLRPLTCDCPKPLVPVMDRPVMEYALLLLKKHGILDIGVTLAYLPGQITDYFGDGEAQGVRLRYYVEDKPLGTAGSVRQAAGFLDETFVVLSGDGLTDCDLSAALEFHRARGALATMVLKKMEAPMEYGVVVLGGDGRVERFVEKPGWGEVFSDTVNTGIYILESEALRMIPEGKAYDFGRELFPAMVEAGKPVFGYTMEGYWCDIGDTAAYLKAHMDVLDGRIELPGLGRTGGVFGAPGARVDKGAVLEGPCFIGANVTIAEGARIGPYSVLGEGCVVRSGASVKRAVLWRGARVCENAQLRGCIVQSGVKIGPYSAAFEESVLGDGAILGEGATLMPGVKVWPHKQVPEGERVDKNLIWGGRAERRFSQGVLELDTPVDAVRGAQAMAAAMGLSRALLARDADSAALAMSRAVLSGLMAQGVEVIDIGPASLAQCRYVLGEMGLPGALHVDAERLTPMDAQGAPLGKAQQRSVRGALSRDELKECFRDGVWPPSRAARTDIGYIRHLTGLVDRSRLEKERPRVALFCENALVLSLGERAMKQAGIAVRAEWEEDMMDLSSAEMGVWLSKDGQTAVFSDVYGSLTSPQCQMLLGWALLESGERELLLPSAATRGLEQLCGQYNARIRYASSGDGTWVSDLNPRQADVQQDGIGAALLVIDRLTASALTLRGWQRMMPAVCQSEKVVTVPLREKGGVLRELAEKFEKGDQQGGIRFEDERGWVFVNPCGDRRQCLVTSEALNAEIAGELCDFYAGALEKIVRQHAGK